MDTPHDLRIDAGGDSFPVSGPSPTMTWKPSRIAATECEVEVSIDGDRPRHATTSGTSLTWPWPPLSGRERVSWRVRDTDPGATWSSMAEFEAGLFDPDWRAEWISPVEDDDPGYGARPAFLLAANVELPAAARSARLYATALGVYVATINGHRVGTTELAPGSTSYHRTLHAQAYDVTDLVRAGENRLEMELSDGWHRGQVGAFREPAQWGDTTAVRAELHVDLVDGRTVVVPTDASWTSSRSPVVRADLMDGQTTDLTATAGPPRPVRVGVVVAPPISWSPAPPVRVVEALDPVRVLRPRSGKWILDFGQNASGWIRMRDLGPRGARTVIEYGEHVGPDGDLTTVHLDAERPGEQPRAFVQRDEVIAGGGADVFEPRHTVHGFRYARVTRSGAPFDPSSTEMRIVQTDMCETGEFACGDADLERLHDIAAWSFRGNAVDVPTDCPTRERLAWTGDYQCFVSTATRLFDVLGFSRKWLASVRDDQLDDGRIANFSPDGRRIRRNPDAQFAQMTGSAGWGDAIVAVPWELYTEYGDARVLDENWEAMVRWVEWALEMAATRRHHEREARSPEPEPFERFLWDGTFHWGEWLEPRVRDAQGCTVDPVKDDPRGWFMSDKGEVGTAYLFRSVGTLARIARILGRSRDGERYAALADRIRDAWRLAYLGAGGRTATDTQAAYVRALAFGLMPDELRTAAVDRLVALIRAAGNHLATGFLSTGDLLPVLAEAGRADVAFDVLLQRSAPSWLAMIDRGATTVWEDWEGIDEHGVAHESLNHYSKGNVALFLHTHVVGIRQAPGSAGWREIVIAPTPGGGLSTAHAAHETPLGRVEAAWCIEGGVLRVRGEVPPGATAWIVLPGGTERRVEAGVFYAEESILAID